MNTLCRSAAAAILLTTLTPGFSEAAIRLGPTTGAILAASRGNAAAYDPINHVYLVVSAQGTVFGRFVDRNGNPMGGPFPIQTTGAFAAYPRATYAPDAGNGTGGFMVEWSSNDAAGVSVLHGRMVAFGLGGAYGAESVFSSDIAWWEEAAYAAYSTVSHEFLVTYRTTGFVLRAQRIGLNAAPLAPPFTVSQTGLYENNPSVAYSPVTNQFLVCWTMFTPANTGLLDCRFVQPGSGALVGAPIQVQATGSVWFTDTTYNTTTNQFLVTWDEAHGSITNSRVVNNDGSLPGAVNGVSTFYAGYDGTAAAYNPVTGTFFMIAYDLVGDLTQDGGVELNANGQPLDTGTQVTALCLPVVKCANYYPQIAGSQEDPFWLVTTATSFAQASTQLVQGTGGGAPPPTPNPQMSIDTPQNGTLVQEPFYFAGWAADLGSRSGNGIDVVHVWAWPVSGAAPVFVGAITPSDPRPDVGTVFGTGFTNAGWHTTVSGLPGGTYILVAYGHDSLTGAFSVQRSVVLTISNPAMAIDVPGAGGFVSQNGFLVGGWAIDRGAASGPGVDAIHVWAWPSWSNTPVFVGCSTCGNGSYGSPRPDVGAMFGANFTNSGYNIVGTLAPGQYTLVVYAHSSVTGTFNAWQVIQITVQ